MTVTIYSDNSDTDPGGSPTADVGFANVVLPSNVRMFEETILADGSSGFLWAPQTNDDPGFVGTVTANGFNPFFQYLIVSDPASVPEPSTANLIGVALGGLGFLRRRLKAT